MVVLQASLWMILALRTAPAPDYLVIRMRARLGHIPRVSEAWMPTYTCQANASLLSSNRKAAIARAITTAHAEVTGAPAYFAQVIFQDVAEGSHFIGGAPLTHDHLFVYGRIRAGRPPETRRALIERLVADVAAAGDLPSFSVWVYVLELPASAMAEFGRVLPEPGEEAAWAASFPSDERERMTSLGRSA